MSVNNEDLMITQINTNSIQSKVKRAEFQLFLTKLKPHITLISETKLNNKHKISFDGYKLLRNDREKNSGGGTAICFKENIDCELIPTPAKIKTFECCLARVKLQNNQRIIIASIYKPPSEKVNGKQSMIKINPRELNETLNYDKNALYLIGGDFNAHHSEWNSDNNCVNGKAIYEWLNTHKDTFNISLYASKNPTCMRTAKGSHIDFGFISNSIEITNAPNIRHLPNIPFSDHAAIVLKLKIKPTTIEYIPIKNYKKTNWSRFNQFIETELNQIHVKTESNMTCDEIDSITNQITSLYNKAIDKFVPNIKIRNEPTQLSNQSLTLIREKKTLLRKKHRNRNKASYTRICSDVKLINIMIENSVKRDISNQIENQIKHFRLDNNIFKNIKKITNYKTKCEMPTVIYSDENKTKKYSTDQDKAEALANHFESIHLITHKNISVMEPIVNGVYDSYIDHSPVTNFTPIMPANFKDSITQQSVSEQNITIENTFVSTFELKEIIKTRNNKKSTGCDRTSNYVLKKMPDKFISIIAIIINHILNLQYIPSAWKIGAITPIAKPNKDHTLIKNYRPITQLSAISKLLEKIIEKRIRAHCETNNLISQCQFGFQPGKSTEMAASKFIADIIAGLNERKPTIAILLDFQAAFDTLWHKALIYKMHLMKFDRNTICLIKNYLKQRKFFVQIGNKTSKKKTIAAGAPQGGILSAILYLLYTNDFPKPTNKKTIIERIMFADDTIIYTISQNIKDAQIELNLYLAKISNYVKCWKLKLNEQKTESISIVGQCRDLTRSIRKKATNIELKINNTIIDKCKNVKYLGLKISSNFGFNNHIEHIITKVNTAGAMLHRAFNNKHLLTNVKILLYKQLIRPIITYACSCWLQITSHQMEKLRRIERKYLRKATGIYKDNTTKKYINSKTLYEIAKVDRIDRKLVSNSIKFINKVKEKNPNNIANIANYNETYINTNKYKPLNYIHHLNDTKQLYEQNKLLIFNKGHRQPNQLIYVTNQNENEMS